jgi:hypothetical protein
MVMSATSASIARSEALEEMFHRVPKVSVDAEPAEMLPLIERSPPDDREVPPTAPPAIEPTTARSPPTLALLVTERESSVARPLLVTVVPVSRKRKAGSRESTGY